MEQFIIFAEQFMILVESGSKGACNKIPLWFFGFLYRYCIRKYMSEFLKRTDGCTSDYPSEIDFDDAVKLPEGGSTCDIYRTKWQRREVFVKRLKEQYRSKPLYLDALDKEFDLGVSLKHPSLPEYREFRRDYIVLDYIDGMTLADMIKRHDPWLSKEKHIVGLLKELVDVVDYLHRHNVVHCDIKPDNIMITANNRNLVLIDFDKSYTDASSDTSGHPGKYGLTTDKQGRVAIDFRGIGMVVEKLKAGVPGFKFSAYKRFVNACKDPDVDCEELMDILSEASKADATSFKDILIILLAFVGLATAGVLIAFLGKTVFEDSDDYDDSSINDLTTEEIIESAPGDSIIVDSISDPQFRDYTEDHLSRTQEEKPSDTPEMEAQRMIGILNERIKPYFDELIAGLNCLDSLRTDTTLTRQQLIDSWKKYNELEHELVGSTIPSTTLAIFSGIEVTEAGDLISATESCKRYFRRAKDVKDVYWTEIDRRGDK